ncbi:GL14518 [Drosophila persimilis]|uniref:GL14518 n=1 Tax=Drosophila persimilis TaxID=7234 RepID=B4GQ94_DROPE|nr:GL14518 [Drosophila persimilis]
MEPKIEEKWKNRRSTEEIGDWRDASLHTVLYEYFVKNMALSSDLGALIGYVLVFVITWYVIIWMARFVLSLVWPVVMLVLAVILIRLVSAFDIPELTDMLFQAVVVVSDMHQECQEYGEYEEYAECQDYQKYPE